MLPERLRIWLAALTTALLLATSIGMAPRASADAISDALNFINTTVANGAQHGGGGARPGGGGTSLDCPAGEYVIGFTGRSGAWIDALGVVCAPLNGAGFASPGDPTAMQGKLDGGTQFPGGAILCPPGMAVDYIQWNMTRAPDAGHVDNIVFECRAPGGSPGARDQAPVVLIFTAEPAGFSVNEAADYASECWGDGGFAKGIDIRASGSVEALDLDCAPAPVPAPPVANATPPSAPPRPPLVFSPAKTLPPGGIANIKLRPQCVAPWKEVSDPGKLSPIWVTQTVTLGAITITCARPATSVFKAPPIGSSVTRVVGNPRVQSIPPPLRLQWNPCILNPRAPGCVSHTVSIPCQDGTPRQADGSCSGNKPKIDLKPLAKGQIGNGFPNGLACPAGQVRSKLGQCGPSGINLQPLPNTLPGNVGNKTPRWKP